MRKFFDTNGYAIPAAVDIHGRDVLLPANTEACMLVPPPPFGINMDPVEDYEGLVLSLVELARYIWGHMRNIDSVVIDCQNDFEAHVIIRADGFSVTFAQNVEVVRRGGQHLREYITSNAVMSLGRARYGVDA